MDNIRDLTPSSSNGNQQTVSLSAIREESTSVNINVTGASATGLSHNTTEGRQVIKINPNRRKPGGHRSIGANEHVETVNPDDFMPKPEKVQPISPRDKAFNQLDAAIARKQQEFKDFIEKATADDEQHRENVELGLEHVDGEMQYMPNNLHVPMNKKDEVRVLDDVIADDSASVVSSDDEDEDDLIETGYSATEPIEVEAPIIGRTVIANDHWNTVDSEEEYSTAIEDEPAADVESTVSEDDILDDTVVVEETPVINTDTEETVEKTYTVDDITTGSVSVITNIEESIADTSSSDFDIDDEDFSDVTVATEEQLSDDELQAIANASDAHFRSEILEKIVHAGKKLNTSQFVVSNKMITINDALKGAASAKTIRTATWPMMFAGRPFKASALKGPEISLLADADASDTDGGSNLTIDQARIVFEHDANPYRPKTLEAWAKTIPYADIESIFAALYVASMKGANYIPMMCSKPSCRYAYLTDEISIDDMIKYGNDDSKKKFAEIQHMELTPENTASYESVVTAINDRFAVGLKLPSIFTVLYEYNTLNPEFARKYASIIAIVQYIDYMYIIDEETNEFKPIGWKNYPGDNTKTYKSKIATYAKILKEFDDTDFSILTALLYSMVSKSVEMRNVSYQIPDGKCPKCGADIAARPIDARGLVFMRQRLVGLATTPSES